MVVPASVRPPLEAYRYWPTGEFVQKGAGKHSQRFVFYNQTFTEFEAEKLARLKAALKAQNVRLPPDWDDNLLLRQVYGTGWKTRNAVTAVMKHLEWRQTAMPADYRLLYPTVLLLLQSGCLYIHGRDCRYRPCLVMQYPRFNFRDHTIEEYLPLIGFFLDYVIDNMMLPGQIENWITITDMGHMGLTDLPISQLRKLIEILQNNYKCRLGYNAVVNAPTSVNLVWTVVKKFLDKDTVDKISITGKSVDQWLLRNFNPAQVERKYGGSAPDLSAYWPPIVPDSPFEASGMPAGALLSQKSSYRAPPAPPHIDAPAPVPVSASRLEDTKKDVEMALSTATVPPTTASTKASIIDPPLPITVSNPPMAYSFAPSPGERTPEEIDVKYPEELRDSREYNQEKDAIPIVANLSHHTEGGLVIDGPAPAAASCCGIQRSSTCVIT